MSEAFKIAMWAGGRDLAVALWALKWLCYQIWAGHLLHTSNTMCLRQLEGYGQELALSTSRCATTALLQVEANGA